MVESVDTRDLKSLGHCGCAGSSPASSTNEIKSPLIEVSQGFQKVSFFRLQVVGRLRVEEEISEKRLKCQY